MAKVGTAYVDIKPDVKVREFIESLKTQLAAIKTVVTFKVKVVPDTKGFTNAITKQLKNAPTVRTAAKEAGAQLGDDMAKAMALAHADALRDNREYDKAMKERTRHQREAMERSSREISRGLQDQVREMNRVHAEALKDNSDYDRAIQEKTRLQMQAMDRATRELQQGLRDQVKAMNAAHAEALRDNADIDRAQRDRTREQMRAMQRATRELQEGMRDQARAMNEAHSRALSDNRDFDRNVRRIAQQNASNVFSRFTEALSATSGGWTKLIANPIGLVLIASFAGIVGSIVTSWVAALMAALAGVGLIGLGAFLVRNEPDVKAAASKLGETFNKSFGDAMKRSAPVFAAALDVLTQSVPKWARAFGDLIVTLQPAIMNLAKGIDGFVTNLLRGLKGGMPAITAALDALSKGLPRIGKAIGEFFTKMDPAEVASAMAGLLTTLENILHTLSSMASTALVWANNIRAGWRNAMKLRDAINATPVIGMPLPPAPGQESTLTKWKKFWNDFSGHTDKVAAEAEAALAKVAKAFDDVVSKASKKFPNLSLDQVTRVVEELRLKFGDAALSTAWFGEQVEKTLKGIQNDITKTNWDKFAADARSSFVSIGQATEDTRKAIDDLVDSIDILNNRFIDSEDAVDGFYDAQHRITELINDPEFKKNVDQSTVLGRERVSLIRDEARAVEELIKADIKNGANLQQVMGTFHEYTSQIKLNAMSLGMSEQAADAYLAKLKLTPTSILTQLTLAGVPGAEAELEKVTGQKFVNVGATADTNQFALVGEYIVSQLKATGEEAGLTFEEFLRKKTQDAFIANQGQYVGVGAGVAMAVQSGTVTALTATTENTTKEHYEQFKRSVAKQDYAGTGEGMTKKVAQGMVGGNQVSNAGTQLGQQAIAGVSAVDIYSTGVSLANRLAQGLKDTAWSVASAAAGLAKKIADNLKPGSPVKEGPLSGAGDLTLAGTHLAQQLATGMLKGQSQVESAAASLAGAVHMGATMGAVSYDALGRPMFVTNVHIGNEQLDAYIVNTVDRDNEELARSMLTGRSGVG